MRPDGGRETLEEAGTHSESLRLRASDLRQIVYCPRIVFYSYVTPVERVASFKMKVGQERHDVWEDLESRRTLKRYGLEGGSRRFGVWLQSDRLSLSGTLDLLISSGGSHYPVEFKDTPGGGGLHHRYQLAAYGLLVEDTYRTPVRSGFLCLTAQKRVVEVPFTPALRARVMRLMEEIRAIVRLERMPHGTRVRGRCRDCEYRNYCGDWG